MLSLSINSESKFNEFEPCLKSAKKRFQLSAGLHLETLNTLLRGTNNIFEPRLKFFNRPLLDKKIYVWNIKGLHHHFRKIYKLENLSLWQRLNSFSFQLRSIDLVLSLQIFADFWPEIIQEGILQHSLITIQMNVAQFSFVREKEFENTLDKKIIYAD